MSRELEWHGKRHTITEWAKRLNRSPATISSRLDAGWTIGQALEFEPQPRRPRRLSLTRPARADSGIMDGFPDTARRGRIVRYDRKALSLSEWARLRRIPIATIASRLDAGWTAGQALDYEPHPQRPARLFIRKPSRQAGWPPRITCNGESLTVAEWAEKRDIHSETIRRRLRAGWTPEQALGFTEQPRQGRPEKTLEYQGRTLTLSQWAKEVGSSVDRIYARLRRGQSAGQALGLEPATRARLVTCHGETLTLAQWAERTGLSESRIRQRLRAGWTCEQALEVEPHHDRRERTLTYDGRTLALSQWAAETGQSRQRLYDRLKRGMAPGQVLGFEPVSISRRKESTLAYDGRTQTLSQWAAETGVSRSKIYFRLKHGMSAAQALGFEPLPRETRSGQRLTYDGETLSIGQWAKRQGINRKVLYGRLKRGWTPEQALGFEPPPDRVRKAGKKDVATTVAAETDPNDPILMSGDGRALRLSQWADLTGIPEKTIRIRIQRLGWDVDDAIGTPPVLPSRPR